MTSYSQERLEAALDCLTAAGELIDKNVSMAERFNTRAFQLVSAALYSLRGEEDPNADDEIY